MKKVKEAILFSVVPALIIRFADVLVNKEAHYSLIENVFIISDNSLSDD